MSGQASIVIEGRRRRSGLSMAPLIDVTFILLIFFMVVTQFSHFVPVEMSVREAPLKTRPATKTLPDRQGLLHLRIRPEGLFEFNGREITSLDELLPAIRLQLAATSVDDNKPLLRVAPEPEVAMQLLIDTMNALEGLPGCTVQLLMHQGETDDVL